MKKLLFVLLFLPAISKGQDTSFVKLESGIYVRVNYPKDTVIIFQAAETDTIYTNEILIVQANNNSAVIKKKVKWILMKLTGPGELDFYWIDSTGTKIDLFAYKNPKNGIWI